MRSPHEITGTRGVMRGYIERPTAEPAPMAVVVVHGYFSGDKVGPARLYVQIAERLAERGLEVWRFDCIGVGDSDGEFGDSSVPMQVNDVLSVVAAVRQRHSRVALIGHSFGANLALHAQGEAPDEIDHLLLLAPTMLKDAQIERILSDEQRRDLLVHGVTIRKGLKVRADFVEAMRSRSVFEMAHVDAVDAVVVCGAEDEYWPSPESRRLASAIGARYVEIPGADHNFSDPESRAALLTEIERIAASDWGSSRHGGGSP